MSEQEPQRKKGGRPRKHSPDAKRPTMAFRINSGTHTRLIDAAAANERSLSEEIERRIDASFTQPELVEVASKAASEAAMATTIQFVEQLFGGHDRMAFGNAMASALQYAMQREGAANLGYRELREHPEKLRSVEEYIIACVKHELMTDNVMAGPSTWPIGIRHNLGERAKAKRSGTNEDNS